MFNNNRKPAPGQRAADTSLIARGTIIRGDIRFTGALHMDGQVEGSVQADSGSEAVFTLSEHGRVTGEVRVPHAIVNGTVQGDIHAGERLELAAQARVEGNVHYKVLEMAAGAQVNGKMTHHGDPAAARQLDAPSDEPAALAAEA
jgi:cytoskeletal protein CcmA (bactofilin family)